MSEHLPNQLARMERRQATLLVTLMCATPAQKKTAQYREYKRQHQVLSNQVRMLSIVLRAKTV